jgi:uncharacterized metal-binding protein
MAAAASIRSNGSLSAITLAGVSCGLGCLSGLVLNPDLDQQTITKAESNWKLIPIIGPLLMGLWIAIWTPYAILFHHRSKASHLPVVSTIIRVLYLGAFVALVMWITAVRIDVRFISEWFWWWFLGLCVSDTAHFLADGGKVYSRDWFNRRKTL